MILRMITTNNCETFFFYCKMTNVITDWKKELKMFYGEILLINYESILSNK